MTPFGIAGPSRILFGRGQASGAGDLIRGFGQRVLIVHGTNPGRVTWLTIPDAEVQAIPCQGEPTLEMLTNALAATKGFEPQVVVGVGGGSVLDLAKALAALIPSSTAPMDHLEVVGRGLPLAAAPLPFVAIPTTSGTGAEVTKNAVIGLPDHRRKVSLRDDRMVARLAIVDPALTDHCPWGVTAASGLDAVVQVIEPYLSTRANDYTDALARPAISRGLNALRRLSQGEDAAARDEMAWVSLCGGLALANAGLGAVHGLAGPIGGMCPAPHGAICAVLLGPVLAMNLQRSRVSPRSQAADRIAEIATMIAAALGGSPEDAPDTFHNWVRALGLGGLSRLGLAFADHRDAARAALQASSMKTNPVQLSESDLLHVLARAS